jgi:hypothetical protein
MSLKNLSRLILMCYQPCRYLPPALSGTIRDVNLDSPDLSDVSPGNGGYYVKHAGEPISLSIVF